MSSTSQSTCRGAALEQHSVPERNHRILIFYLKKASQLVINRQSGRIEADKRFGDINLGSKLRAWAKPEAERCAG